MIPQKHVVAPAGIQPREHPQVKGSGKGLPLHFATKVGVARGIDCIQGVLAMLERGVLGIDGDPSFLFQDITVHEALLGRGMPTVCKKPIHKRRLAVVDMSCRAQEELFRRQINPRSDAEQCDFDLTPFESSIFAPLDVSLIALEASASSCAYL